MQPRTRPPAEIEPTPRYGERPPVYPKGRVCVEARVCGGKTLSIYNRGPECNQCAPSRYEDPNDVAALMCEPKS